jgi:hypothetical protein
MLWLKQLGVNIGVYVVTEIIRGVYLSIYRVHIHYHIILQNHIFTNTEQKYMVLLPFERGMFAVS